MLRSSTPRDLACVVALGAQRRDVLRLVAIMSALVPARRAARVNPIQVLRGE